ncbi:MAG: hypothetical protein CL693_00195 [Cellvibrionaceae bacterium]|nr:hypothetical protein [Cellvibrionaceae bacterium]|tara:strand:- start:1133 stop:1588 length:456 start_codon:yes stop_codon:yes gene_type:complete
MNDDSRTTAIGLARYAADFLEASLAADDVMGKDPLVAPVPVLYLMGHALELYLKAYLRHNGRSMRNLKNLGHNLVKCHQRAQELGLDEVVAFSSDELEVLGVLNQLYHTKKLNYIETGAKEFPMYGPLENLAKKLDSRIAPHVGYKERFTA